MLKKLFGGKKQQLQSPSAATHNRASSNPASANVEEKLSTATTSVVHHSRASTLAQSGNGSNYTRSASVNEEGFVKLLKSDVEDHEAFKMLLQLQQIDTTFSIFDKADLKLLSQVLSVLNIPSGQSVMCKGEPASFFGIILKGDFQAVVSEELSVKLRRGALVGEMAYFESGARSADIVASGPQSSVSVLAVFSYVELEALFKEASDLHRKLVFVMSQGAIRKLRGSEGMYAAKRDQNSERKRIVTSNDQHSPSPREEKLYQMRLLEQSEVDKRIIATAQTKRRIAERKHRNVMGQLRKSQRDLSGCRERLAASNEKLAEVTKRKDWLEKQLSASKSDLLMLRKDSHAIENRQRSEIARLTTQNTTLQQEFDEYKKQHSSHHHRVTSQLREVGQQNAHTIDQLRKAIDIERSAHESYQRQQRMLTNSLTEKEGQLERSLELKQEELTRHKEAHMQLEHRYETIERRMVNYREESNRKTEQILRLNDQKSQLEMLTKALRRDNARIKTQRDARVQISSKYMAIVVRYRRLVQHMAVTLFVRKFKHKRALLRFHNRFIDLCVHFVKIRDLNANAKSNQSVSWQELIRRRILGLQYGDRKQLIGEAARNPSRFELSEKRETSSGNMVTRTTMVGTYVNRLSSVDLLEKLDALTVLVDPVMREIHSYIVRANHTANRFFKRSVELTNLCLENEMALEQARIDTRNMKKSYVKLQEELSLLKKEVFSVRSEEKKVKISEEKPVKKPKPTPQNVATEVVDEPNSTPIEGKETTDTASEHADTVSLSSVSKASEIGTVFPGSTMEKKKTHRKLSKPKKVAFEKVYMYPQKKKVPGDSPDRSSNARSKHRPRRSFGGSSVKYGFRSDPVYVDASDLFSQSASAQPVRTIVTPRSRREPSKDRNARMQKSGAYGFLVQRHVEKHQAAARQVFKSFSRRLRTRAPVGSSTNAVEPVLLGEPQHEDQKHVYDYNSDVTRRMGDRQSEPSMFPALIAYGVGKTPVIGTNVPESDGQHRSDTTSSSQPKQSLSLETTTPAPEDTPIGISSPKYGSVYRSSNNK